jgi:hypothetical protein
MHEMKLPAVRYRYLVSALIVILVGRSYHQYNVFTVDSLSSSLTGTSESKSEAGVLSNEQNNADSEDRLFSSLTGTPTESQTNCADAQADNRDRE